jgi:hypothetical protein
VADPNRALFESVVRLLSPVLDDFVFVGGCTTGLFVKDSAAAGIRPTKDVDAIVATKLEAFRGRSGGDVFASHDLEDIVAVVDGRPEIVEEIAAAAADVRAYVAPFRADRASSPRDFVRGIAKIRDLACARLLSP